MQKFISLSTALICAGSAWATPGKFDLPDLSFEKRLHQNYVMAKTGNNALPDGVSENYRLQNGETLWSLSEMLYGDGSYWPRVWAQKNSVTKPHLIRPGHRLEFRQGSEDEAPAFRFSEEDDEEGGVELAAAGDGSNPIVEIPPPEVPPKPVLKIPGSFPEWQSVFKKRADFEGLDDKALGKISGPVADRIWLTAYVQETPLETLGEFLENEGESGLPLVNQYVYLKIKKGTASIGQKLLVVKDQGRIKRVNKQWDGKEEAYLIQLFAEVELSEEVPATFKRRADAENFSTYRAMVTRSTGLSLKDCTLIAGQMMTVDLSMNGRHGSVDAMIIGSEKHIASAVAGPGEIVFLNKGSSDGVTPGDMLDVYADRTIRHRNSPVQLSPAASGTLRVVKVSNHLATAIMLKSHDSVMQGDQVRAVSASAKHSEQLDLDDSVGEDDLEDGGPSDDSGGSGEVEDLDSELDESEEL
jgi:hypothetical protein